MESAICLIVLVLVVEKIETIRALKNLIQLAVCW